VWVEFSVASSSMGGGRFTREESAGHQLRYLVFFVGFINAFNSHAWHAERVYFVMNAKFFQRKISKSA